MQVLFEDNFLHFDQLISLIGMLVGQHACDRPF